MNLRNWISNWSKKAKYVDTIRFCGCEISHLLFLSAASSIQQKREDDKEFKVDDFVMGDDWKGKFDFLSDLCEVVYLSRTPEISTTKIKSDLLSKEE